MIKKSVSICCLVVVVVFVDARPNYKAINTPNAYKYIPTDYDLTSHCFIEFDVKAWNAAHVNLMENPYVDKADTYEIVIGGWGNTHSVIRKKKQGPNLANKGGQYLSSTAFRRFWVSWGPTNYIRVGTGNELLLEYKDPLPYRVSGISVSTGWGATGQWRIYNPQHIRMQTIITKDEYRYIPVCFDYTHASHVTFEVQAWNAVHVNLMADVRNDIANTYEIVIGGWGNTQSVIRRVKQGAHKALARGTFLNRHKGVLFTVAWTSHGEILVGNSSGWFMTYSDPAPYKVTGVSVSTGWGATGTWRVHSDRPPVRALPYYSRKWG